MRIAVLGCGNMASAIVKRIHNLHKEITFLTYTPTKKKAKELAKLVDGEHVEKLIDFVDVDAWIIACKPQQFESLANDLKVIHKDKPILSIMASIGVEKIKFDLRCKEVLRIMPNTPSEYGEGISLLYSDSKNLYKSFEYMFKACGLTMIMDSEKQFDELTVFSGSGPGFLFYIASLYQTELEKYNVPSEQAMELLTSLFYGTSVLMKNSNGQTFLELAKKVTSKGGVTEAGIRYLDQNGMGDCIDGSVKMALKRGIELSKS